MGLIEIRSRSERLGNIGGVGMADTGTGAARLHAGLAESIAQSGRTNRELASGIAGLFDGANKIAADFVTMRERRDQELADRYVARFQEGMSAYNDGTVDANGNRVPGAMERDFGDSGRWIGENIAYRDRLGEDLRNELKMSDRAMEIAGRRLVGYNLHTQERWQRRAMQVDDANARAAANERLNGAMLSALDASLDPESSDRSRASAWLEYQEAVENMIEKAHVPEGARADVRRKAAYGFCQKALARRIGGCEAVASGLSPEEAGKAFDGLVEALKDNGRDWEALFPFGTSAVNGNGKSVANPIRDHLAGADMEEFRMAAIKDVKAARSKAVHEAEARERETNRAVLRDFAEKELAMRDVPQELWADRYDEMGKNEALKKAAPDVAMNYRDTAAKMREAEKRAKEKASVDAIKANENRIYGNLINFIYDKKFGIISGQAAADRQAEVWRDFRVAVAGRAVGEDFPDKFTARLDKELNDQQAEAMRYMMQLFGYNAETDSRGRVGAAERKKTIDSGQEFKTPFKEEGRFWDSQPTISASQLFDYLDRLWRLLDGDDKGGNRLEMAKKMADGMKEEWDHGGFDGMIEGLADDFMKERIGRRTDEEYREAK